MTAVQITEHVWVVGSPDPGPAHTSPFDCVQYLLWDGRAGVLVDTGTGLDFESLVSNISSVCPLEALEAVLVTHYHGDHAGGVAEAGRLEVPVYASHRTAQALREGDEQATQVARARACGVYPETFRLRALGENRMVPAPETIELGRFTITPVSAEGHCDGHLVYLVEDGRCRMLFSGDVIFAGGRISMQAIPDCRLDVYAETVARLDDLGADQLFPGHGEPVTSSAGEDISSAARSFARLVPPPNLLT